MIAQGQKAKSWELRAVMSLCRTLIKQDNKKQAKQILEEIYGLFSEGLNQPDLLEAKSLLDQLT